MGMNKDMNRLVDLFGDLALEAKKIKSLSFVHWDSLKNGCADPLSEGEPVSRAAALQRADPADGRYYQHRQQNGGGLAAHCGNDRTGARRL